MPQTSYVRAKFDGTGLVIIDRSPNLPAPSGDAALQLYLHILSLNGWNAVRGEFDGWDVILTIEKQMERPYQSVCMYMVQMLQQMPCPDGISATAEQHTQLIDPLQNAGEKAGWKILAGPKHLTNLNGLTTIAIWVKTSPVS